MSNKNIVFWLRGFLEGKESLSINELNKIKEIIGVSIDEDAPIPTDEELAKMIRSLFPDLKGNSLDRTLVRCKEKAREK